MAYALLIVEPAGQRQERTEAQGRELYDRMLRFSEELRSKGLLTLSQSLASDQNGAPRPHAGGAGGHRGWSLCRGPGNDRRVLPAYLQDPRGSHRHRTAMPRGALGDG